MKTMKVHVENITSDKLVRLGESVSVHQIVCDHTYESGLVRRQELMICSDAEYESIMSNGCYEVPIEANI